MHTDVPEFRGANRKVVPQWLLVVMHHSGLVRRVPHADRDRASRGSTTATAASSRSGPTARPGRAQPPPRALQHRARPRHRLGLPRRRPHRRRARRRAPAAPDRHDARSRGRRSRWALRGPDGDEIARYRWDELRFSVSWKAYCFRDAHERDTWREHRDDLTLDAILDRLVDDLRTRDRVTRRRRARSRRWDELLIDEYVDVSGVHNASSTG